MVSLVRVYLRQVANIMVSLVHVHSSRQVANIIVSLLHVYLSSIMVSLVHVYLSSIMVSLVRVYANTSIRGYRCPFGQCYNNSDEPD